MSLRYLFRLIQAFFKRFKVIIAVGIVVGVFIFLLVSIFLPTTAPIKERVGIVGRFTTDNLPSEIGSKISYGLTSVEEDGNVVPALASSWETSDGGKTWQFQLDETKFWQDGKRVLSSDLNYEFSDAKIEVVNDNTIRFKLDSNFAAFPIIVSKPVFKKGLLGTGEWKVKDISLIGGFVQKITIINKNKDRTIYKFYPSEERLKLAFKLGEVDILSNVTDISSFSNWKTINITQESSFNNFVGVFLNFEDEALAEKSVRQALAYGIDKRRFGELRATSPISPYSWGYNPQVKPYELDLEKTEAAKDLKLKLSTLPNLITTAEQIADDWKQAGIEVEVEVVTQIPEKYQAFLATVDIPLDPDQYSLWHSTQTATNISNFRNDRIDKLLEDGRRELDQETRRKIYLDFQRFLVEDVPAIFLYHPTFYEVRRK